MAAIPLRPRTPTEAAQLPYAAADKDELVAAIDELVPKLYHADDSSKLSTLLKIVARARSMGTEGAEILKSFAEKLNETRAFDDLYILTSQMAAHGMLDEKGKVRRWEIQALIELGVFETAIDLIQPLLGKGPKDPAGREGYGALGRVYKQIYLDAMNPDRPERVEPQALAFYVQRSINAYRHVWDADRTEATAYFGVNAVAIAMRAARDQILAAPDAQQLAQDVFNAVSKPVDRDGWSWATQGEALVALGRYPDATMAYGKYAFANSVTLFQLASSLRQLEELWQVSGDDEVKGAPVRLLKAAIIAKLGNMEKTDAAALEKEGKKKAAGKEGAPAAAPGLQAAAVRRPLVDPIEVNMSTREASLLQKDVTPGAVARDGAVTGLQQVFLENAPLGLPVLLNSLERAKSVCRIHARRAGAEEGIGSGFAVSGKLLCDAWGDAPVVVTNNHVISTHPNNMSFPASACAAVFVGPDGKSEHRIEFGDVLWESDIEAHDVTILRLKGDELPEGVAALRTLPRTGLPPRARDDNGIGRVYIIGYPAAGQLSFSIADNIFLDHDAPEGCDVSEDATGQRRVTGVTSQPVHMHYKTPTLGGSSGSPVFDFNDYALLGVHHRGLPNMERLRGREGSYAANEGIWIESIRAAITESMSAADGHESGLDAATRRWRAIASAATPLIQASAPLVQAAIGAAANVAGAATMPAPAAKPKSASTASRLIAGSFGQSSPGKSPVAEQVIHLPGKAGADDVKAAGMETIIGVDSRTRVFETAMSPWRMICAIRAYWGTRLAVGTGCLIGPSTILTAGHVVFPRDKRTLPDDIEIIPALNGADHAYGQVKAIGYSIHPMWQSNGVIQRDVAVIHLDRPIGNDIGWFGVASQSPEDLRWVWANVSGYPGEKIERAQPKPGDRESAPIQATQLWHHSAPILSVQDERIFYAVDTTPGQSGAPIYVATPAANSMTPLVVGVHAYGVASTPTAVGSANSGAWISPDLFDIISMWREESKRVLDKYEQDKKNKIA